MIEELRKLFAPKPNQGMSGFQFADLFDNERWRTAQRDSFSPKRGEVAVAGDPFSGVSYRQYVPREPFVQKSDFMDAAPKPTTKRVTKEDDKGVTVTTTETYSDFPSVPNYYGTPGQMQHSVYQSPIRNVPYQYSAEEARSDVSAVPRTSFPRVGTLDPYQPLLPSTGGAVGGRPYPPPTRPATSRFVPWTPSINERTDVAPVPLTRFPREANLNSGNQFRQRSFVHPFMPVLDALIPPASADLSSQSLLADQQAMGMETAPRFEYVAPPPIADDFRDLRRDEYGNLIENFNMTDAQRDAVNELRRSQQFEQAENYDDSDFSLMDYLRKALGWGE